MDAELRRALPLRGPGVRELGLPLPPVPMPGWLGGRPLKRWRYVGVFGPDAMLCVADVSIGPLRQRFWAVATAEGLLGERTVSGPRGRGIAVEEAAVHVLAGDARIDVELDLAPGAPEAVEVVSSSGESGWAWTHKRAGVRAVGSLEVGGRHIELDAEAVVDESAGYHERRTIWRWSAGVGRGRGGERLAWNLVDGIHDAPGASERTVWVDGAARETGTVRFSDDLRTIAFGEGAALELTPWAERRDRTNLLLVRSSYRQPFGTFSGTLPGGLKLAAGYGVTERHDVRW